MAKPILRTFMKAFYPRDLQDEEGMARPFGNERRRKRHDHMRGLPVNLKAHSCKLRVDHLSGKTLPWLLPTASSVQSRIVLPRSLSRLIPCSNRPAVCSLMLSSDTPCPRGIFSILSTTQTRNCQSRMHSISSSYDLVRCIQPVPAPLLEHFALQKPVFDAHRDRLMAQVYDD